MSRWVLAIACLPASGARGQGFCDIFSALRLCVNEPVVTCSSSTLRIRHARLCVLNGHPTASMIAKKGHHVHFRMIPENKICSKICSISCSSSVDLKIVQCGGDGSVTAEATTDYAKGTVFVTKTCTRSCTPVDSDNRRAGVGKSGSQRRTRCSRATCDA